MTRIFVPQALQTGIEVTLAENAARHLAQVLRMRAGEPLKLFDGRGGEYEAAIACLDRRSVRVVVLRRLEVERESPLKVILGQCVSKGERMDFSMQKAVELGVDAVMPLLSARSVVRVDAERWDKKLEHWRGVITAAAEQSGRTRLPSLGPVSELPAWLAEVSTDCKWVLAPNGVSVRSQPRPGALTLLIGPEGGLAEGELQQAERHGFLRVGLGPRILRTETAGIAALAALQTLWGDY